MARTVSRRRFVSSLSRVAALAGSAAFAGRSVLARLDAAATGPDAPDPISNITHQSFAPHVGSVFRVTTPDGTVADAVLTRVTPLPRHTRAAEFRDPFSIAFAAADSAPLESLVEVSHKHLGRFALALHASGTPGSGMFEAVFG